MMAFHTYFFEFMNLKEYQQKIIHLKKISLNNRLPNVESMFCYLISEKMSPIATNT